MTNYQYRVASRCIPGSEQYAWYEEFYTNQGEQFNNDWQEYRKYDYEATAKAQRTRLAKQSIYDNQVEWAVQRRPVEDNWELI